MSGIEIVGLAAASIELAKTAAKIGIGIHNLRQQYKEIPQSVNDLFHEQKLMRACLLRFQTFASANEAKHDKIDVNICEQASAAVVETKKTLDELERKLKRFLPEGQSTLSRATVKIAVRFVWSEKSLQAMMTRLRMRREAIAIIMDLWTTNDAAEIRRQLETLHETLRDHLTTIREQNLAILLMEPAPDPAPLDPLPPQQVAEPLADTDDTSSVSSVATASTTVTIPNGLTGSQHFTRGLIKGQIAGPRGQAVQRKGQSVVAAKAASVAARAAATPGTPLRNLLTNVVAAETTSAGLHSKESAKALTDLAKAYEDLEDYGSALEYYHQALICREQILSPGDPAITNTLESIATAFELALLWDDALAYWLQCFDSLLANPKNGPNHPTTLAARFRLARAKGMGGNDDDALAELTELLSLYETSPRTGGMDSKKVRWEISKVQSRQGQYIEALEVLNSLLSEFEAMATSRARTFGAQSSRTREATDAVTRLKQDISTVEKKREVVSKAKGKAPMVPPSPATNSQSSPGPSMVDEPSTAPDLDEDSAGLRDIEAYHAEVKRARAEKGNLHPDTLDLMFDLANAYASHERHESAIGWFKEALKGQERNLPVDHPEVAKTEFHLARSYIKLHDIQTALAHLQRVLAHREARLGANNPDTLAAVLAIGSIYSSGSQQDLPVAVKLVERAVTGFLVTLGPKNDATLNAQFQMAELHMARGQDAQGIQLHQDVLARRLRQPGGEEHEDTQTSKMRLANAFWKMGMRDRALPLYEEAFHGCNALFNRVHSTTCGAAAELAEAYWALERWQDALKYYTYVLEGIKHRQPGKPMATLVMLHNISMCYASMGDCVQGLEYMRKVLELHEAHSEADAPLRIKAMEDVATFCMRTEQPVEAIDLYTRVIAARTKAGLLDSDKGVWWPVYQLCTCTYRADQRQACLGWVKRFLAVPSDVSGVTVEMRLVVARLSGLTYINDKQAEDAVNVYQRLLEELRDSSVANDHWLRVSVPEELAEAHRMRLAQTTAIADLHARQDSIKRLLDTDRPFAIALLAQVADVHLKEHEYSEAVGLYEEVLDFIKEVEARRQLNLDPVGENEPDLAALKQRATSGLANGHIALANHARALELLAVLVDSEDRAWRRSALIRTGDLKHAMSDYGGALETWMVLLGEIQRAIERGERGAEDDDNVYGDKLGRKLDELRTMRKIASLHLRRGEADHALRWTNRSLEGFRSLAAAPPSSRPPLGADAEGANDGDGDEEEPDRSPKAEVYKALEFLAVVNTHLGRNRSAITAQREAAEGFERTLGPRNKLTLAAALALAEMYTRMEERDEAIRWYNMALAGYENLNEAHPKMQDGEARRVAVLGRRLGVAGDQAA